MVYAVLNRCCGPWTPHGQVIVRLELGAWLRTQTELPGKAERREHHKDCVRQLTTGHLRHANVPSERKEIVWN